MTTALISSVLSLFPILPRHLPLHRVLPEENKSDQMVHAPRPFTHLPPTRPDAMGRLDNAGERRQRSRHPGRGHQTRFLALHPCVDHSLGLAGHSTMDRVGVKQTGIKGASERGEEKVGSLDVMAMVPKTTLSLENASI